MKYILLLLVIILNNCSDNALSPQKTLSLSFEVVAGKITVDKRIEPTSIIFGHVVDSLVSTDYMASVNQTINLSSDDLYITPTYVYHEGNQTVIGIDTMLYNTFISTYTRNQWNGNQYLYTFSRVSRLEPIGFEIK